MLETILIAVSVLADRLSKIWASNSLQQMPDGTQTFIPGVMDFYYMENRGMAFSMLWGSRWVLVLLSGAIVVALSWYLIKNRKQEGLLTRIALAAIIGGALGNFIDRLLYGYVVDMFRPTFVNFAVFNVADIFVTGGTILLLCLILFSPSVRKRLDAKPEEQAHEPE